MIYIEPINKKWEPGKRLIKSKSERKKFEEFMAKEYIKYVQKAVYEQKYSKNWTPLSPNYYRLKEILGLNLGMWIATGDLISSLRFVKYRRVVTFKRKKHYSGSSRMVIARTLEYGSMLKNIPPRPLFRTVASYMSKHISIYYKKFKEQNESKNI